MPLELTDTKSVLCFLDLILLWSRSLSHEEHFSFSVPSQLIMPSTFKGHLSFAGLSFLSHFYLQPVLMLHKADIQHNIKVDFLSTGNGSGCHSMDITVIDYLTRSTDPLPLYTYL